MPTILQLLSEATAKLHVSESARLDAEILLAFSLNKPRSYLYSHPEQAVNDSTLSTFNALVGKRQQGTPVAYLTGQQEFWSLPLAINETVLIPRPETELLVEQALLKIPADKTFTIADLGTGSGAIALAIASERPRCRVIAVDLVLSGLLLAKQNAQQAGLNNIHFICTNWCSALQSSNLDMIVSNPPYIAASDPHLAMGDVRFEPRHALAAGPEGLDAIQYIINQSVTILKPDGWLLLEHGYDQQQAVAALLRENNYTGITGHNDLAGHPRVSLGRVKPGKYQGSSD